MSSSYGNILRLTLFGQSHGPAVGMTLENFPLGFCPDLDELQTFLNRRAPGCSPCTTGRKEADRPEFLSGLENGKVCGTVLTAVIPNSDARSSDYDAIQGIPRPSHADYPARTKFGEALDLRGGGQFSGRLTAPLCIAGGLCIQYLKSRNISVGAQIRQIGSVKNSPMDTLCPTIPSPFAQPTEEMEKAILSAAQEGDSLGGIIECAVTGLPAGVGEVLFGGLESRLSQLLFTIPAVKGVEFGSGFACAEMTGSQHNDPYYRDKTGAIRTRTNHAGGICGGLSTGMPLIFRVAVKPTPSIALSQESISADGPARLEIRGRHDPCIVPRAVPCVEAAAAVGILDALLEGKLWT